MSLMFKNLAKKLNAEHEKVVGSATVPISINYDRRSQLFLDKLSRHAVDLYEREQDVKKFTELALGTADTEVDNNLINRLFSKGVIDPFQDKKLNELSSNQRFLKDLGLINK